MVSDSVISEKKKEYMYELCVHIYKVAQAETINIYLVCLWYIDINI